ncbi:hypothetical protein AUJ68_03175 [Candidatus Woesearchaeota archaeon CG1_02_57_44]|nr:MAG: hypothetical protein AUJ68_03175 [Candidatus Woesearchaeota archaeon CG1_02_57_44]PIN70069.1 MAG: hypothetical protein COV94_02135 [Candidatus Woesearchaeota archaeon CG11_big_fil_rev_8_21_14_0_20_57_5]
MEILTGPDKLLDLVRRDKRVAVSRAAKELKVGAETIKEWARFLEEGDMISTEYGLSQMFLIERQLSKKEVAKKLKDYEGHRDAFQRKIEASISGLHEQSGLIKEFQDEFSALRKRLGSEMGKVGKELSQLQAYQDAKRGLEKTWRESHKAHEQEANEAKAGLKDDVMRIEQLLSSLREERSSITKDNKSVAEDLNAEAAIMERINALGKELAQAGKRAQGKSEELQRIESHLSALEQQAGKLLTGLERRKAKTLDAIEEKQAKQDERIKAAEEALLTKMREAEQAYAASQGKLDGLAQDAERFLKRKQDIEQLLSGIDHDEHELEKELTELFKKTQIVSFLSSKQDGKKYLKELDSQYNRLDKKRDSLRDKVHELLSRITDHGKTDSKKKG